MPRIIGYGRVSTDRQELSFRDQTEKIESWVQYQQASGGPYAHHEYGGTFEESISAVKHGFFDRPIGSWIAASLEPKDVLVVSHLDRLVRNARYSLLFPDRARVCARIPADP